MIQNSLGEESEKSFYCHRNHDTDVCRTFSRDSLELQSHVDSDLLGSVLYRNTTQYRSAASLPRHNSHATEYIFYPALLTHIHSPIAPTLQESCTFIQPKRLPLSINLLSPSSLRLHPQGSLHSQDCSARQESSRSITLRADPIFLTAMNTKEPHVYQHHRISIARS